MLETILDTVYACTQAMTMKRRTTGQLPALARSNWNAVDEMSELDEDSLMEEKAAQLKILKHGEHQSHPLSLVRKYWGFCCWHFIVGDIVMLVTDRLFSRFIMQLLIYIVPDGTWI